MSCHHEPVRPSAPHDPSARRQPCWDRDFGRWGTPADYWLKSLANRNRNSAGSTVPLAPLQPMLLKSFLFLQAMSGGQPENRGVGHLARRLLRRIL